MKKKTGKSGRVERFADGSSLETLADGSVVLREGGLAVSANFANAREWFACSAGTTISTGPHKLDALQFASHFVPQALYIEMGFPIGFIVAANIIHARQGAASTLIEPPADPAGN